MAAPRIQELEIKDSPIIFNTIWQQILHEARGEKNLHFPKEARQDRHYFTCLAARLAAEVHDFDFGLCGY